MKRWLAAWFALATALPLEGKEPPNILLIVSEDNGPELGCYGQPHVETPVLDALASRGIRFERAYVPQAGCSQSRAALLTGLYPHQNGQIGLATWKFRLYDEATPNLVTSLKAAGYRTGIIGKLHINPSSAFPFDFEAISTSNFARNKPDQYATEARRFIEASDKPFFLSINYPDAHRPFLRQVKGIPENPLEETEVEPLEYFGLDTPELRLQTADYLNCLNRLDVQVGELLEALRESGKAEETLVIYLGDHGADLLRGKRTSYEGGVRIPLMLSWPGVVKPAQVRSELVSTLDLLPTLLEVSGSARLGGLPGRSLVPMFSGVTVPWRRYLFTEYHTHSAHNFFPQRTVRDERFKLIQNLMPGEVNPGYEFTRRKFFEEMPEAVADAPEPVRSAYERMKRPPEFELYDLDSDPFEFQNLAEDPEHAHSLGRLRSELESWRRRTNDPLRNPEALARLKSEIGACLDGDGGASKGKLNLTYPDYFFPSGSASLPGKKNVLFLAVDDLRPALGCYDDPVAQTPNLDRLARRGTVFMRAYCQEAVCAPSRLSLMTGRRPDTIRVWDLNTHFRESMPDVVTLPQLFKSRGYAARSIGKLYHGSGPASKDPVSWSEAPVFDTNREPEFRYAKASNLEGKGLKRDATESASVPDSRYIDGLIAEEAIRALAEYGESEQPFFLAVGFKKPHLPFCAPKRYWDLYDPETIPGPVSPRLPEGAPEWATRSWKELEGYRDIPAEETLNASQVRRLRHGYYACVSYIDAQVGRVLDQLETSGLDGNTVICLWGDHGFHLGEQGLWTKANNYELSTRVPLIVVDPDIGETGQTTKALVELVDIYPTLAELCGLPPPEGLEGCSLVPLLRDPQRAWKPAVFSQYPRAKTGHRHKGRGSVMGYAVRSDQYRYVEWQDSLKGTVLARELYDQETDPEESRNLVSQPGTENIVERHRELLRAGWSAALPPGGEGASNQRPNVLFLAVDDMKDWVNCLGGYEGTVHTPNLDRLAARGTLFTNAHCPSPKCGPSRASVMTGLMPSTTGVYDNGHWWYPHLLGVTTIPVHFRKHGYEVVGAGKIFHHTAGNHPPNQWQSFHKLKFRDDPWFRGVKLNYPWSEHAAAPEGFPFSGVKGLGHENDWGSLGYEEEDYDDSRTASFAVRFLEGDRAESPFFLACGLFRPHLPWYVPEAYFKRYPLDEIVLPRIDEKDLDDVPEAGRAFARARRQDLATIREAGRYREAVRAYLASITYADAQLGRVLEALDASGQADNTIIVLWSDHGWHLGEKGHWHKTTLWEESTRVPFIVTAPGRHPGRCSRPVSLVDLFPTLNELCHLSAIESHDGQSLVPLLDDPRATRERPAIIQFKPGNVAVRSERFRYIRYRDGSEEFYDLRADPHEWANLAGRASVEAEQRTHAAWATGEWADPAPGKSAYEFDPDTFTWNEKSTGRRISGATPIQP